MEKIFALCAALGINFFSLCATPPASSDLNPDQLKVVKSRIKTDWSRTELNVISAIYNVSYVFFESKLGKDWYYIRRDVAEIPFGFDVDDIEIEIDAANKILKINLAEPVVRKDLTGVNRKTVEHLFTSKKLIPQKNGKPVDVEKVLNEKLLDKVINNEKDLMQDTKKAARTYFEQLAISLGLELNLTFDKPIIIEAED